MRPLALVVVLLAGAALAPAGSGANRPRHHCNPPGAKSVARDQRGRVYYVERDGDQDYYYACLYRTGRTRPLGGNPHSIGEVEMAGVDLAMPYVAFTEIWYSSQATTYILNRLDMRSGRTIEIDTRGNLKRFVATTFGTVVWAQYRPSLGTTQIVKFDKDGNLLLDEGDQIDAKSLRLSRDGHRVYWRNDGQQKSERLR